MAIIDILGVPHLYELTSPHSKSSSSPVLIFIHGWLLSRKYWQPLVDLLSSDCQCLIYDLRGFGDSQNLVHSNDRASDPQERLNLLVVDRNKDVNPSQYSLAAYAKDLSILLQKLNIEQAWLIGHSLGGSIALWGADFNPDTVKGVICLNSGGGIYLKEEFERFRAAGKQLVKNRPRWLRNLPLLDLLFARIMVHRPLSCYWGRQRIVDFLQADEEAALGALLETTTETEVHLLPQVVSRLQQPTYFLAGTKDKVMEPKYVCHLASFHQLFNNAGDNVIEIEDCGHLSMLEQSEFVASIIVNILKQHQPRS